MSGTDWPHDSGDRTRKLMAEASEVLAYGGQHRALLRPLHDIADGAYPQLVEAGCGYELTDSTGRSFIDWMMGWGPAMLGYRHPVVERAVAEQLAAGPTLSLMHPIEIEVASMLVQMVPCADMVAFGKNGSDALTAAIRVARSVTERELVLQHGFHGFHDWYTCLHGARGVLPVLREFVHPFPYNDLDTLEQLFETFNGQVAAVVMEPTNTQLPNPGYLEGVRELTSRHSALLVFDEMITGFRLANGGAQELFGVTPDLTCLGKAMANGMPLSAIVGRREYMKHLPSVGFGMTFRGETLSLAAARAVLRILREEPVTEHLARIGSQLRDQFSTAAHKAGVRCELLGPDARMSFAFHDRGPVMREDLALMFILECARLGVLTNGMLLPSYAHDEHAVEKTIEAFRAALEPLAEVTAEAERVVYEAIRAGFAVGDARGQENGLPDGWIDSIRIEGDQLAVMGWMLLEDGWPDIMEFVSAAGERVVAEPHTRPDLESAFPQVEGAANGGYQALLPRAVFAADGRWDFTIRALRGPEAVFCCRVQRELHAGRGPRTPRWSDNTLQI